MVIYKEFSFDSAHFLSKVPDTHKCRQIHGHTYRLVIFIEGEIDAEIGWVMDFAEIKAIMNPLIDLVDHKLLNDIPGLENPTCELFAKWIWDLVKPKLPLLSKLELHETPTSGVVYQA